MFFNRKHNVQQELQIKVENLQTKIEQLEAEVKLLQVVNFKKEFPNGRVVIHDTLESRYFSKDVYYIGFTDKEIVKIQLCSANIRQAFQWKAVIDSTKAYIGFREVTTNKEYYFVCNLITGSVILESIYQLFPFDDVDWQDVEVSTKLLT